MSQKRNRSINWDEEEKQLLRSVLKEYSQIIENKSLDTNTNKIKLKAWEEVHKKFNQLNSRPRELNQLKIQWKTMKVHARKTCSAFKKEVHKTGGGPRPATPDNSVIEIRDLLNPAELLRDDNFCDSDGKVISELELPSSYADSIIQDSKVTMTPNKENKQLTDIAMESIQDTDSQVQIQEFIPLVFSPDNASATTPMDNTNMDSLGVKMSADSINIVATPVMKRVRMNPIKTVPKRKIVLNNTGGNSLRSKDQEYVTSMINHSKILKDDEHMRRMEIADAEHAINMAILKEKLKSAVLEREIFELKKARELLNHHS